MSLQDPSVTLPTALVGIDRVVNDIQLKLDTNLIWLTHDYGRMYRNVKKSNGSTLFFPEIYLGGKEYYRPTPDNDKKGMIYFVVGQEETPEFLSDSYNYLTYDIGIVFWVNLGLIDPALLQTEIFTQNLIEEARNVVSRRLFGGGYKFTLNNIQREFSQIYKEFPTIKEEEDYLRAPYSGFRINGTVQLQEDCINFPVSRCQILQQNISKDEISQCLLPTLDFSDVNVFNNLTPQQIIDIEAQIHP